MKLSIITINYNNREGLQKTIESVVNQTWREFEYIVIDGGSTDGSVDVIKQYLDRIDYWVSEPDKGIYHAMNKGIDVAKGEYCNFMNSGDCFYENTTLENIKDELANVSIINGKTAFDNGWVESPPNSISLELFYTRKTINHQSSFIETQLLRKYKYDESLKIVSDWKFWIQAFVYENCTYKAIDSFIALFNSNGISLTNNELRCQENEIVLKELIPERILLDYLKYNNGWERQLYNEIVLGRYHRYLYTFNVLLIRFLSIFRKSSFWIKKYPLFLDKS